MPMNSKLFFLTICLTLCPALASAQDEEGGKKGGSVYIEMRPAFIATFGGPGPLKYVKTEITLIAPEGDAEPNIKLHKPALRHTVVMLLSKQRSENFATAAGRDHVRAELLEDLRKVMTDEYNDDGYDMIKDLLFTSFVVQD